jgi:hypothetical protein
LTIFSLRSTAGNWLFCNRRWLNPLDREDRQTLDHNYDKLCLVFPAFARCSKATFIHVLMDVSISWSDRIGDGVRRAACPSMLSSTPSSPSGASWPDDVRCALIHPFDEVGPHSGESGAEEPDKVSRRDPTALRFVSSGATSSAGSGPVFFDGAYGFGALAAGRGVLNAGEAVDMKLHEHWACVPTLRIEASELERFGRSKSF